MIKITGIRDAQDKLDKLKQLGTRVSFGDMFPPEFISSHSGYSDMEKLIEASGFVVESEEDFKAIPDSAWEGHIVENTKFDSWRSMQEAAFKALTQKTLSE